MREYLRRTRKQDFPPLIISAALTGGLHGKEVNPKLPETPEEQVEDAFESYRAGASIIHIHARDPNKGYASASSNRDDYYKINKLVREACKDVIISNTTGGGLGLTTEQRTKSLDANPELASLNMGPLAWKTKLKKRPTPLEGRSDDVMIDEIYPPTINWAETELFAKTMLDKRIKPEMEVFHQGQFHLVYNLIDKGLLKKPYFIDFVMGAPSGVMPTPKNLINMLEHAPSDSIINVIATGPFELPITTISIALGLNARVGMEDNVYYKKGVLCDSNAQLVERLVRIAKELNRRVTSPGEARSILGLPSKPKEYK